MTAHHITVILSLLGVTLGQVNDLPDYINVCRRNDPNIEECVRNSIEVIRPYLVKGIPELQVPALEPLLLREVAVAGGQNILRISAKDIRTFGCSNFLLTRLQVDAQTLQFSFSIDLPLLLIQATYEVDGRILLIPIKGTGPMRLNITDCRADIRCEGDTVTREGEEYLYFRSMEVTFVIGDGQVRLDNLFGTDGVIGDAINAAINNNFPLFLRELQPSLERELSRIMLDIANNIAAAATLQRLFPDN